MVKGIALCLAEEGGDVAVADINAEQAKKVADWRKPWPLPVDLTMRDLAMYFPSRSLPGINGATLGKNKFS